MSSETRWPERERRWLVALVREAFRPRQLGGPREDRLEQLTRGEIPEEGGGDDAG